MTMNAKLTWFEIPVEDMIRAQSFYNAVLNTDIKVMDFQGMYMGFFPENEAGPNGALVQHPDQKPSMQGITVYFNCGEDLSPTLNRVETVGGKIIAPKTQIGDDMGFYAWIADTEGNRVGLYSDK
jgi:uncharacterized protein